MNETKTLIAYFSRRGSNYVGGHIVDLPVGNTEVVAGLIQKLAGGDTFRIETVKPYPSGYQETTEVAQRELDRDARPELAGRVEDMADYGVVLLGYPNWWGTAPMAVRTFLESYDFTGKTILPFCTHEGSGMGSSERDLKRFVPGAQVRKGLPIRGGSARDAEKTIEAWLRTSGLVP